MNGFLEALWPRRLSCASLLATAGLGEEGEGELARAVDAKSTLFNLMQPYIYIYIFAVETVAHGCFPSLRALLEIAVLVFDLFKVQQAITYCRECLEVGGRTIAMWMERMERQVIPKSSLDHRAGVEGITKRNTSTGLRRFTNSPSSGVVIALDEERDDLLFQSSELLSPLLHLCGYQMGHTASIALVVRTDMTRRRHYQA